ncbi:LuxR C-terminal-related transcriptional regulator [Nocardioides endophyticus]|uniref:LuxR C-terminal-related transcriptional regulator n=1 Tax=Nocardioides endophyticus TaxID=1353775 RepID=A0ABP8Z5S7_9ACTN
MASGQRARATGKAPVHTLPSSVTPRPPELFVPRARLDEFLDTVPATPVNLMIAPAGSGKTAAAAAWSARVNRASGRSTVAWARGDQDAAVAAQIEEMRCPEQPDGPTVVVIDDVHLMSEQSRDALGAILVADPDSVRLLLIGRQEPDLVPISAALTGSVRALRVDDLRFDETDAADLVRAHHPDADPDDVAAVLEQADGWAAALVLGSRALAGSADIADARASLAATRQPVLDYLLHEVFETLPDDLAQVLLTTCQRAHVTAEESILLSGLPDAPTLLDQAAAAGLLVTGYRAEADVALTGWRYHPLLLDLLRRRTAPTGPDWAVIVAAHHRATEAYAERRDAELAVRHAGLTGDLDLQLRVLREFASDLISQRRYDALGTVLAGIPLDIRTRHADLLVVQAMLLRGQGRIDAAKATTDRVLALDGRSLRDLVSRDTEAQLALLEVWQARYGWREAGPALERAGRVLGCRHDAEVSAHDLSGLSPVSAAWLTLEVAYFQTWLGEFDLAAIHVQDVAMYARQVDLPVLTCSTLAGRAVLEMVDGAYQSSLTTAEAALLVDPDARADAASARIHLSRGWALLQELRLTEAEDALARFYETPSGVMDPLLLTFGRLLRAGLQTAVGEAAEARRILDTRGDVPERLPHHLARLDRLVRLLIAVAMGDLATVDALAPAMRAVGGDAEARLAEALSIGLGGDEPRAVRLLNELLPTTVDAPVTVALSAAVARAAMLQRIGTPGSVQAARDLVPELLSRAAPQRLIWMLAFGSLISPTFGDLVSSNASGTYPHPFAAPVAAALGGLRRSYPEVARHRDLGFGPDDPRAPLTARELEVLEQLSLGGGNADLARALFVSENTVKTHLASIYRKLEVDRRVDALRVARAHGLL